MTGLVDRLRGEVHPLHNIRPRAQEQLDEPPRPAADFQYPLAGDERRKDSLGQSHAEPKGAPETASTCGAHEAIASEFPTDDLVIPECLRLHHGPTAQSSAGRMAPTMRRKSGTSSSCKRGLSMKARS